VNAAAAELYGTDKELINSLVITNNVRALHVLYSVGPLSLNKGDIVDVRVQAVLSSECKGNSGIGRYIIRTKDTSLTRGKRIIKAVMSNITVNDHHAVLVHSGIELIENTSENNFYNFVIYAQSTQCEEEILQVEGYSDDGFGELVVLIH
jgi:hypothetical protein